MSAHTLFELPSSGAVQPEYGWTADGDFAAKFCGEGFAMIPVKDGSFYLCKESGLRNPIRQWRRSDFPGREFPVANELAFRERVWELARDRAQRAGLGRHEVEAGTFTPWGLSEQATVYGPDIVFQETASHGGFHLTCERNARVHPKLRAQDRWYEQDREWAAVAQAFPLFFTDLERQDAEKVIRNWFPDAWEAIHDTTLKPGQSHTKDRRAFEAAHADSWIVISAIASKHRPGHIECVATPGGNRSAAEQQRFLVPEDDYVVGRFGFVIDEERHQTYGGLSSFRNW